MVDPVTVPLGTPRGGAAAEQAQRQEAQRVAGSAAGAARPGLSVLLVEDDAEFRGLFRRALRSRFPAVPVREAGSVREGLRDVRRHGPRLVFLDVRLPDGSGLSLARTVCAEHPEACVVVCTGHDLPEYEEAARRYGAAHFLVKHRLDFEQVHGLVAEALRGADAAAPKDTAGGP